MKYQFDMVEVDPSIPDYGEQSVEQETPFVENRGLIGDLFSAFTRGTASTLTLLGQGTQQAGFEDSGTAIRSLGESLSKTNLAKPDEAQYLGVEEGRAKQIALGVAEGAPYVLGTIGAGVAGTLTGIPGAGLVTAGSFLGLSAGAGTYKATMEELALKRPDLPEWEREQISFKEAAIQTATESVGSFVSFGAGKIFGRALTKPVLEAGLRGMVETGEVSAKGLIGASLGKASVKDLAESLAVAGVAEGSTEVAAQILSEANREAAGLENDPTDLFNVFASAAILGGVVGGAGYASSARDIKRMRQSINYGLSSEDPDIRNLTVQNLSDRLEKLDPEAAAAFQQTIGNAAIAGPIDLEQMFKIQREYPSAESTPGRVLEPWEANLKTLEQQGLINQITQDPASVLESEGIPTGVAPVTYSTNPYGTAEFVENRVDPNAPVAPYNPAREVPQSAPPGIASYQNTVSSPYAIAQGMQQVIPETNQLVGQTAPPRTLAEIQREKEAVRTKAERSQRSIQQIPGTAQYLQPQGPYAMAQAMAQVDPDSNNVVQQPAAKPTLAQKQVAKKEAKAAEAARIAKVVEEAKAPVVKEIPEGTKNEIIDLQAAVNDTTLPEKLRNKYAQRLEKLTTEAPKETLLTDTEEFERKIVDGVTTYVNKDTAILKLGDREWSVSQKAEGTDRVQLGTFESLKAAKDAAAKGTIKEPKAKKERQAKALNEKQKEILKGIDVVGLAEKLVAISPVKGDPEAVGVAEEAILYAAEKFDPEKGAKFSTFAGNYVKGKLKTYFQKRSEIQSMELQATQQDSGEGSVGTSSIESATKADVQSAIPLNIQEKVEKAPAPVTKVELSEEEKAKVLERVKAKTLREKQAEKAKVTAKPEPIESVKSSNDKIKILETEISKLETIKKQVEKVSDPWNIQDVKAVAGGFLMTGKDSVKAETLSKIERSKERLEAQLEKLQETEKDEAPVIVRKAKSTFVPTKEVRETQAESITKAQQILQRAKFNKETARTIANAIRDPQERQEVLSHIDSTSTFTVGDLLRQTLRTVAKDSDVYKLASFLNRIVGSKSNLKVVIDPQIETEYFDHATGSVFLRDTTPGKVTLHEIVHAITARELQINPALKARVREIMGLVEQRILEDDKIQIDKKLLDRMKKSGSTSKTFRDEFGNDNLNGDRGILYALLNEKEFLAQAMNDTRFQDLLKDIEVKDTKRSVWDYVVDFFRQIFGTSKLQDNALREVLQLTAELAQVDLSYGPIKPAKDMIFIGEKALGINKGSLLDAKYRSAQRDSRANIRKDTGWFLDADGFWKYEIDDSRMRFVPGFDPALQGSHNLESVITHSELFEKYPFLKDIKVEVTDFIPTQSKSSNGLYDPNTKTLYLKENLKKKKISEIIVHELQHAIQYKEGFAPGSSSGNILISQNLKDLDDFLTFRNKQLDELEKTKGESNKIFEERTNLFYTQTLVDVAKENLPKIKQVEDRIKWASKDLHELFVSFSETGKSKPSALMSREMDKLSLEIRDLKAQRDQLLPESGSNALRYEIYRMVAGEVEARNSAYRKDWSPEKRKLVDPLESQDVADNYKLFTQSNELSESIDMADHISSKKTWEERAEILAKNDVRPDRVTEFKNRIVPSVTKFVKDIAQTSTERLRKINPKLLEYVRRFEFGINKYNVQYHDEIRGFLRKYEKMDRKDQRLLDLVLLNDYPEDVQKRWEILGKYKMEDDYTKVVGVLKDIYKRKQMVDLGKFQETPDYFPRVVKDRVGLIQAMKNDPSYGVIEAELEAAGLNEADRELAIQNLIDTGRFPALAILRPGADKKRRIERVSSEWAHYYMSSMEALTSHIYESNEAIEARRMFGDVTRKKLVKERSSLEEQLNSEGLSDKRRKEIVAKINVLEDRLSKYEEDWHEGISTLLAREGHELDAVEQSEVVALIRARLLQKGMTGFTAFLRNVSLMTALGGPGSAVTQLTDLAVAAHVNGLKNLGVSLLGPKRITTKDLDLSHSMREFQTEGSARFLEKVLKLSGLKFMDTFGKNTFMNAAIEKAKGQSLEKFTKAWGDQLGSDTEATWNELKSDKTTDLTRFFAFNALSEWQPTSMSEMPMKYLEAKNGRIFYALKSYNIKMINNFARELVYRTREARSPMEKASAIKDAGKLLIILTLAGATADELKDFIFGRNVDFSDNVHNNILKIFFMNTYMLEQGDKKGMVKTMLSDTLLPPTRLVDDAYADIRNLVDPEKPISAKTLKSLPWGTLVYAHFTDDAERIRNRNIKEKISERVKAGESIGNFRQEMMTYNRWAKKNNEPVITHTTIRNMRRRAKEKQRT